METSPVKRKRYMTKRIKTQLLYWKILLGGVMLSSALIGGATVHTGKYILKHGIIQPVRAETEPIEEVVPETVEDMIRRLAKEANFEWADYLVRLARCESNLDPNATGVKGNTPKGSRDRGLFQINSYWQHQITDVEAYNPEWATKWTMDKINAGYQSLWACDKKI